MHSTLIVLLIASFIGFVYFSLRLAWWRRDIGYKFPRVLMYHMVREHLPKSGSKFNRLRVRLKEFESQLNWLKKNGFTSYFSSEISDNLPEKSVIITFDDGYRDNLVNALPLLKKYGFKATIYIVVNRLNKDWANDKDLGKRSDELNAEDMLSHSEIVELLESGLIEIGSHTLNHANLPSLNSDEKRAEIIDSKLEIERLYGVKCKTFAYPFGFYDEIDVKLTKDAGYKNAVTTVNGVLDKHNAYEIPRILISGRQNILHFMLKMRKGRCR